MPTSTSQMQQVRELIKAGKKKEAVARLAGLIERDHENPELWWLLANANENPNQARAALEQMLSLSPNDERAQKLLRRLEARQLLRQMGVNQSETRRTSNRPLLFAVSGVVGVAILIFVAVLLINRQPSANQELPTLVVQATEEPAAVKTDIPAETTSEALAIVQSTATEEIIEPTAEPTTETPPTPTTEVVVTVEVDAPTNDLINPESTSEVTAGNLPLNTVVETPFSLNLEATSEVIAPLGENPLALNPESTGEALPPVGETQSSLSPLPNTPETVHDMKGQVLDGVARRELIDPYALQGWTFSGYRGEKIKLELVNITGEGNPSLELRDEAGKIVTADIDLKSGNNKDALIEIALPSDGIYTVVVRMASVEQQLYSLTLTRSK